MTTEGEIKVVSEQNLISPEFDGKQLQRSEQRDERSELSFNRNGYYSCYVVTKLQTKYNAV